MTTYTYTVSVTVNETAGVDIFIGSEAGELTAFTGPLDNSSGEKLGRAILIDVLYDQLATDESAKAREAEIAGGYIEAQERDAAAAFGIDQEDK